MVGQRPFISVKSIRAALEDMLRGTTTEAGQTLLHLAVVEEFITQPHVPEMENPRDYAIHSILTDLITYEYARHRQVFEIEVPRVDDPVSKVQESIRADILVKSAELVAWSTLYYRYVRSDLSLGSGEYAELANFDERTFRRYQANAYILLRDALVDQESSVRLKRKQRWLYAQLPDVLPNQMVGRDQLAQEAHRLLRENPPPWMLVTGQQGVGKTAFVQMLIRQMIAEDILEHVIWISQPRSSNFVRELIRERLLHDDEGNLTDVLLRYRTAIVLDDVTHLVSGGFALHEIVKDLGGAILFVIHHVFVDHLPRFKHVVLTDLEKPYVMELVKSARAGTFATPDEGEVYSDMLWQRVGGNPLAIQLVLNTLSNLPVEPLFNGVGNLVVRSLLSLSEQAQALVWMLGIFPPGGVDLPTIRAVWPAHAVLDRDVIEVASTGFVRVGEGQFSLTNHLYENLPSLCDHIPGALQSCAQLVEALDYEVLGTDSVDLIEHILSRGWPMIPIEIQQKWAEFAHKPGIQKGHYAVWHYILGQFGENLSYPLTIAYAMCLRRLGYWEQAESEIGRMIKASGQRGDFGWQGRGLCELAALYRQRGDYSKAQTMLEKARITSQWSDDQRLSEEIEVEHSYFLVESGNITEALRIIKNRAFRDLDMLVLLGEASVATGKLQEARAFVLEAIRLAHESEQGQYVQGRLYSNLGRIYALNGDHEEAEDYLMSAITILEQASDLFGVARAKSVMGAVLIAVRRDYDDALRLLTEARESQLDMRDRSGLIYTWRNLEELERWYAVDGNTVWATMRDRRS